MEWILIFATFIFALGGGITATYLFLRPRIQAVQELDTQTAQKNEEILKQNRLAEEGRIWLETETKRLIEENNRLLLQKDSTLEQINTLNSSITAMEKQAQEAADLFYTSKMEVAQENLARSLEIEAQKYQENISSFEAQYQETVAGLMEQYKSLEGNVALMRSMNDAAVAAAKRAEEMKTQQDYYRIQMSAADLHEIELLRQVEPYLRDKESLNKVIWKCYYEKPTTDLIGRVIGAGLHTGIYKITEIASGKCYVGQAANLAERWKQHIKRGVGAETPTRNKLYPAMIAAGPENFTFEVVEECARALLDEREDYWQDYFKAKEFGFSIK